MDTPITAAVKLHTRVLEVLSKADGPMTALDVYDKPEIKELCNDSGKISVLMSDMWRNHKLTRQAWKVPNTKVKYAYTLSTTMVPIVAKALPLIRAQAQVAKEASPPTTKPQITVTEHQVVIELSTMKITIDV